MFAHLRYLAIASFFIMVIGAFFITRYTHDLKQENMIKIASQQVEAAISSYTATIWDRYAAEITANPASPYLPGMAQETSRFFQKHGITKITIFSTNAKHLFYSSGNDRVINEKSEPVQLDGLPQALSGSLVSNLRNNAMVTGSADPNAKRTMLQIITPITRTGGTAPDALGEFYIDLSSQSDQMGSSLYTMIGAIIGIFTLLIVVLLITASRAEGVITKQHEVNMELIAAAAQAEAQSRDKSQFLASVSHELRTPLNAIIGFSDIVRNEAKEKLEKIHQEYIDDINASGKHLLSLINDILDFSKAEAGKLQIEWAETDATKVIRNSLRMVMPRAETAQVTLVEDIPIGHLVIVTDAKKLKQVLLNLMSNAVKFTPAGGEVRCHAWHDVVTGALNIEVRDTGIGIAPKDISRVMTPFGQVDSALSRKYEGTGLGLPLSKKFVESMGGTFTIESQLNVGTCVTISIPKAPPGWGTAAMAETTAQKDERHVA